MATAVSAGDQLQKMRQVLSKRENRYAELFADGLLHTHLADASKIEWKAMVAAKKMAQPDFFDYPVENDERGKLSEKIDKTARLQVQIDRARRDIAIAESFMGKSPTPHVDRPRTGSAAKLYAQKPKEWTVGRAKDCTPAEYIAEVTRFATRTMRYDLATEEGQAQLVSLLRDCLAASVLTAIDVNWDRWDAEQKTAGSAEKRPTPLKIQEWMEQLLSSHKTVRDLKAEHGLIKMEGSDIAALTKYTIKYQGSLNRLENAGRSPTVYDQKNDYFNGLHSAVKVTDVKKFARTALLEDDDQEFGEYVLALQEVATEELASAVHTPPKIDRWRGGKKRKNDSKNESWSEVAKALTAGGQFKKGRAEKLAKAAVNFAGAKGGGKGGKGGKGNGGKGGKGGKGGGKGGKGGKDSWERRDTPKWEPRDREPCSICGSPWHGKTCWHNPKIPLENLPSHVKRLAGEELAQYKASNLAKMVKKD